MGVNLMNLGKSLMILVLLFSILGVFTFVNSLAVVSAENTSDSWTTTVTTTDNTADPTSTPTSGSTWVNGSSNVGLTALSVTIHLCIKNTKDHVQYFKISQTYSGGVGGWAGNETIKWKIIKTSPQADSMIDTTNNGLPQADLGWKIQPGETKEVSFTISAIDFFGTTPAWIGNAAAVENTYWPLIPDMGLYASWFQPNEIEMLNPDLDLLWWKGTFSFDATNLHSAETVHGIIRAPIVPTDSLLTYSSPKATFLDRDIAFNAQIAAWDDSFEPNTPHSYTYTYEWPISADSNPYGNGQNLFPVTAANNTTTVPTQNTGAPYGLLVLAVIIVGAGLGYAKFLR